VSSLNLVYVKFFCDWKIKYLKSTSALITNCTSVNDLKGPLLTCSLNSLLISKLKLSLKLALAILLFISVSRSLPLNGWIPVKALLCCYIFSISFYFSFSFFYYNNEASTLCFLNKNSFFNSSGELYCPLYHGWFFTSSSDNLAFGSKASILCIKSLNS